MASVGKRRVDRAANPATTRATEVKKPKTACARLSEECIARGEVLNRSSQVVADEASWACLVIDKRLYSIGAIEYTLG